VSACGWGAADSPRGNKKLLLAFVSKNRTDYYIMTHQVVHSNEQGQKMTTEFKYSNVRLLEPAVV